VILNVDPASFGGGLQFDREFPDSRNPSRLRLTHALVIRDGAIALDAPCLQVETMTYEGAPAVWVVVPDHLRVYDLRMPSQPRLALIERAPGLRGGMRWRNGFLAWGVAGFELPTDAVIPMASGLERPVMTLPSNRDRTVRQAVSSAANVFALTDSALEVYDERLEQIAEVPMDGGASLALRRKVLAVATDDEVKTFDVTKPVSPTSAGSHRLERIRSIRTRPLAGAGSGFLVKGEREWRMLQADGNSVESVRYLSEPWFASARRLKSHAVRLVNDGRRIELWSIESVTSPPPANDQPAPTPR
jgi:hypothetical protein